MTDYETAKQRAVAKLAFYIHAIVFLIVNVILIAINLTMTPQNIWFIWPLLGWGIGLAAHAGTLYFPRKWGHKFMHRMIQRELDKQQKSKG